MGEIFDKLRRKLAGWVLGERTAIYLPAEYRALKEGQLYERLPDHELAQLARYFFYVSRNVNRELADERGVPAAVFTQSQAILSVIRYAIDANATEAIFTQSGEIDGDDIGVWQVKVTTPPGTMIEPPSSYSAGVFVMIWAGQKMPPKACENARPMSANAWSSISRASR